MAGEELLRKRLLDERDLKYEVKEVYVYIPAELSAAGVELKIAGSVVVINKVHSACRRSRRRD